MSLAILKRKASTRSQSGNARIDPPGSNSMARKSNHIFEKVSGQGPFSINGSSRHTHYIGRGSHRATSSIACRAHTTNIKPSVSTNAEARRKSLLTRSYNGVVQPDSNFPDNDSQGVYIFNKKLKHDCVVETQAPDCSQLPNQKCRGYVGSRVNPTTPFKKDFAVLQSYDEYLSKRLIPECAKIDMNIYPKKINNIGITNARCSGPH